MASISKIEFALTRLECLEESIQELHQILSNIVNCEQLGYLETKKISKSRLDNSTRRKAVKKKVKSDTEFLILEAAQLLEKEREGKKKEKRENMVTSTLIEAEKAIKGSKSEEGNQRNVGNEMNMSPEQNFYLSLANGHIEVA